MVQPELSWSFAEYQSYEQRRAALSDAEQDQALADGLIADPKSALHGGYRVACTWSDPVIDQAAELSARLAATLPGTPAYPAHAIHSSIGNQRPDGVDRQVDPERIAVDRVVLDRLCGVVEEVLGRLEGELQETTTTFAPGYLAPRMAYVFARTQPAYWRLHQTIHAEVGAAGLMMAPSWGPHLTLTRFGAAADAGLAKAAVEVLESWRPVSARPIGVTVGYYTVAEGEFDFTAYRTFPTR